VKTEFFHWGIVTAGCVLVLGIIIGLSLSPLHIAVGSDPYSLLRYLLLRIAAIAIAAPALTGLMIFVDFVTPGDWMRAIGDDAKACSYIMSAVILVIGAVLCWT
jgi:hypothetical protein